MSVWNNLAGYDSTAVELTGRIVGKRPGEWRFDDGVTKRWIPKQYLQSYCYLKDGFCILTIPAWLAAKPKFQMKRQRFSSWSAPK